MSRRKALRWALGIVIVFACGASCDSAGCDILQPLPDGNEVPMNQTIEGGIQLRVTDITVKERQEQYASKLATVLALMTGIPAGVALTLWFFG